MSGAAAAPGDSARASVLVQVPPAEAFRVFHQELDQWWLSGIAYRAAGRRPGTLRLEPWVGGRLLERFEGAAGERQVLFGQVTAWEPPRRLAFTWRAVPFAPHESTHVEVDFEPRAAGTLVTVTHSGWSRIRADHPARHGLVGAAFVRSTGLWWGELLGALRRHAAEGAAGSGPSHG